MRTVFLPALNRTVSLAAYLTAVRDAKAHPATTYAHGLTTWWPTTGAEIRRQFLRGLMERINAGVPYLQRGSGSSA